MARNTQSSRVRSQWGGTFLGLVLGLIVGLAIAVVVAVYITKAPVPFVSRNGAQPKPTEAGNVVNTLPTPAQTAPQASAPQAADPNAPLWSRVPPKPVDQPDANNPPPGITIHPAQPGSAPQAASAPAAKPAKPTTPATPPAEKPVTDPIAEIARQDASKTGYFLQVGAYKSAEDAERQKGNLAMQGFEAKVTQREVNGVTMYRVRLGPYNSLDDMTAARSRLQSSGVESSVIRFARQ